MIKKKFFHDDSFIFACSNHKHKVIKFLIESEFDSKALLYMFTRHDEEYENDLALNKTSLKIQDLALTFLANQKITSELVDDDKHVNSMLYNFPIKDMGKEIISFFNFPKCLNVATIQITKLINDYNYSPREIFNIENGLSKIANFMRVCKNPLNSIEGLIPDVVKHILCTVANTYGSTFLNTINVLDDISKRVDLKIVVEHHEDTPKWFISKNNFRQRVIENSNSMTSSAGKS